MEAEWARIVAGYHTEVAADSRSWPAAEDVAVGETTERATGTATSRPGTELSGPPDQGVRRLPSATEISGISVGGRADDPSLLDGLDTFGADLPDDQDERYVPPPPPPLPRLSKYAVVGVLAIVTGFVLFLFPHLLPIDRGLVTVLGFAGILGGFVTLIWRLRPGNEEDDDPDDGAVV
ncbi:hypothetical protein GCM10027615_73790 [Plantactinospora veratri]